MNFATETLPILKESVINILDSVSGLIILFIGFVVVMYLAREIKRFFPKMSK